MRSTARLLIGLAAITAVTATGCSEVAPTGAPVALRQTEASSNSLLGGLLGLLNTLLVAPVERTTPLASNVSWSFTAGPGGAVSSRSDVGLTVYIPAGALSSTTTITVTALAGAPIAYRFEPHLEFDRKVRLTQDLRGASTGGLLTSLTLTGAHFDGDAPQFNGSGLAIVTEVVPSLTSLLTHRTTFGVSHFSGWIVASGYAR